MRRLAVVTGGTKGIGFSIAEHLVEAGCHVIVTGRTIPRKRVANIVYHKVDFTKRNDLMSFANLLKTKKIDILINNAGINRIAPVDKFTEGDFLDIMNVNLKTPFFLSRAVIPKMKEVGWGRIVNISSVFGMVSKEYRAVYSATKFGLRGLTAAIAAEVSAEGILANSVSPGFIDTALTREVLGPNGMAEIIKGVPICRLGTSDEVAKLVVWLSSPENTYVTGQNIAIDGGFTSV